MKVLLLLTVLLVTIGLFGCSAKPPYAETKLQWETDIKPIFEQTCLECHGGSRIEENFNVMSPDQVRENIWLIYKMVITKEKMPPKNTLNIHLSQGDRIKINNWIRGNAPGIGPGTPY
ncbi:MAG: hypothetical protein OEM52_00260 [bacterium]|nr:hypothetical protein [bacterium]